MRSLALLLCCCLVPALSALSLGATTNAPRTPALRGDPISPVVDVRAKTFVRYIYEGGTLTRGRLCLLPTASSVSALDVLRALVHPASDGDVMARVESLVEREYLESSSPGVFNYLP